MVPLDDPVLAGAYKSALANWRFEGYVLWEEIARHWVEGNLPGYTTREIARRMHEHVEAGGRIDQVIETRPEWSEHDYHYDLRIPVEGRLVYIETRLRFDDPADPDDPVILVVNAHDA
jgi:hypothetical protein